MTLVSIVIPARNEAPNIGRLIDATLVACAPFGAFEIVVVDDGATDGTADVVRGRMALSDRVRLLSHRRSGGQSAAIHSGVTAARGRIVATMDGDGQNPPEDLPRVIGPLIAPGADPGLGLVAGQRQGRKDTWSKRAASRIANAVRRRLLRDGTRDTGCGLKAFRRDDYLALPYFDHMHRFLPALFARAGWRIRLVDVGHRERMGGTSHYSNLQRGLVGAVDLLGMLWLIRRRKSVTATERAAPASDLTATGAGPVQGPPARHAQPDGIGPGRPGAAHTAEPDPTRHAARA